MLKFKNEYKIGKLKRVEDEWYIRYLFFSVCLQLTCSTTKENPCFNFLIFCYAWNTKKLLHYLVILCVFAIKFTESN